MITHPNKYTYGYATPINTFNLKFKKSVTKNVSMERRVTSSMECATPSPKPKGLLGNRIRGVATRISGQSDGEIEDAHNRMRWRREAAMPQG
jgi:hypothetical protein